MHLSRLDAVHEYNASPSPNACTLTHTHIDAPTVTHLTCVWPSTTVRWCNERARVHWLSLQFAYARFAHIYDDLQKCSAVENLSSQHGMQTYTHIQYICREHSFADICIRKAFVARQPSSQTVIRQNIQPECLVVNWSAASAACLTTTTTKTYPTVSPCHFHLHIYIYELFMLDDLTMMTLSARFIDDAHAVALVALITSTQVAIFGCFSAW